MPLVVCLDFTCVNSVGLLIFFMALSFYLMLVLLLVCFNVWWLLLIVKTFCWFVWAISF